MATNNETSKLFLCCTCTPLTEPNKTITIKFDRKKHEPKHEAQTKQATQITPILAPESRPFCVEARSRSEQDTSHWMILGRATVAISAKRPDSGGHRQEQDRPQGRGFGGMDTHLLSWGSGVR